MRARSGIVGVAVLLASCADATAPGGILTGKWQAWYGLPSGANTQLTLRQKNSVLSGTAQDCWGPSNTCGEVAQVSGVVSGKSVTLALVFPTTGTIQYSGALLGSDTISVVVVSGGSQSLGSIAFARVGN